MLDSFKYFAFCDQDDIWESKKLIEAIRYLDENDSITLYCSKRIIMKHEKMFLEKYPKKSSLLNFEELIFENKCYGNTMVFKANLRNEYLKIDCRDFKMPHDWLIGRIALATGEIHFDIRSHLKYRIHSNNATGKRSIASLSTLRIGFLSKVDPFFLREYKLLHLQLSQVNSTGIKTRKLLNDVSSVSRLSYSFSPFRLRLNPKLNWIFKIFLLFGAVPYFKEVTEGQLK